MSDSKSFEPKPFNIWIDADSCPVQVRELTMRFAKRLCIRVFFVANHPIPFPKDKLFSMIVSDDTPDAADNHIVENVCENDLVITRDIPLAHRLVKKNICTINDRGTVFTENNINEKLALRNFNRELFEYGIMPEKTSTFGKKELNLFSNSLDKELQKLIRKTTSQ